MPLEIIKAPAYSFAPSRTYVFLAGSIEMDKAEKWQDKVYDLLQRDVIFRNTTLINPRRDEWDSSWEQSLNNPNFYEQVNWELDNLEYVDFIIMYFDPNTKSPISLMELGLYADSGKLIVCCPDGFWRKGNVDILCQRYNIPIFTNMETMLKELKRRVRKLQ